MAYPAAKRMRRLSAIAPATTRARRAPPIWITALAVEASASVRSFPNTVTSVCSTAMPASTGSMSAVEHTEVTVFGNDRTEALASTANAMIQIGGALLGLVIAGAMALSLLILLAAG